MAVLTEFSICFYLTGMFHFLMILWSQWLFSAIVGCCYWQLVVIDCTFRVIIDGPYWMVSNSAGHYGLILGEQQILITLGTECSTVYSSNFSFYIYGYSSGMVKWWYLERKWISMAHSFILLAYFLPLSACLLVPLFK